MNAQKLKNAILQEAIEGRLVPQDPNDGIVNLTNNYITPKKISNFDEYLFDIPESWKWCKMFQVSDILGGFAFKSEDLKSSNGIRVIRISDIAPQGLTNKNIVRCSLKGVPDRYSIKSNDILIAMTGGTVGKSLLLRSLPEPIYLNQRVAVIRARNDIYINYLDLLIKSPLIQKIICDVKNSTNDNISMADISGFPIPLPPLAEQYRIVAKIEELLPTVEEYGKAQEALDRLNAELPERLKKSILQEAIQGRLVPQDPNDEPASVLLNRIREEKKQLVKEGKLKKKDLEETPISEDEIPFDIPDSWEWVRLYDCVNIFYGYPFESTLFNEEEVGFPLIRIRDVLPARTKTYTTEVVDERYIIKKGDMLVGMDGNFNVRFWNSEPAYLNQRVCKIETKEDILSQKYLYYYLPIALENIFKSVSFVTVKHLSDKHLRTMHIPLPPLAEQKRIVAKIEEAFKAINALS